MERIILIAREGMILTNGEAYGREIYLGLGDNAENWCEMPLSEYEEIMRRETPYDQ